MFDFHSCANLSFRMQCSFGRVNRSYITCALRDLFHIADNLYPYRLDGVLFVPNI